MVPHLLLLRQLPLSIPATQTLPLVLLLGTVGSFLTSSCQPASCLYSSFPTLLAPARELFYHRDTSSQLLSCAQQPSVAPNAEASHWGLQSQDSTVNNA